MSRGHAAGWCVHYRSPLRYDKCTGGVSFESFHGTRFDARPCFLTSRGESKPGTTFCAGLRRPTADEIAEYAAWIHERYARTVLVKEGIEVWRKANAGRDVAEVVACPACGGRLHLSIARVNGHVHARCETEDCVSWME